jgi:two-component system, NarL family, response regulator
MDSGRLAVAVAAGDVVRRGRIAQLLRPEFDILVSTADLTELLEACRGQHAHVAVLGVKSLHRSSLHQGRLLREQRPDLPIVAVTASVERQTILQALRVGIGGVVKDQDLEASLAFAVQVVCSGQVSLPRELRDQVGKVDLSTREKQILGMVVLGFSNGEIARKLVVTESTVKSHLSSAFSKLGVRSRTEATALILDPHTGLGTGILAISGKESARADET